MDRLSFTTGARADEEAFAAYHDLYHPVADVSRIGDRFSVDVRAHRLGDLILFDRRMDGVRHSRNQTRVARNGFDHFTVQLSLGGLFRVATDRGDLAVPEGGIALIDMDRTMRNEAQRASVVTLSVPRPSMEKIARGADRLHGLVLAPDRVTLFRDFVASYLRMPAQWDGSDAPRLGRIINDLLGLVLGSATQAEPDSVRTALDASTRQRARHFIDANLTADPDDVARGIGRSRTALYRALELHGGVAHYIRTRRLARLRSLLADAKDVRTVAQLSYACGFASESHCTRSFKAAYGLTPRDYRALRRGESTVQSPEATSRLLERWWSDLR